MAAVTVLSLGLAVQPAMGQLPAPPPAAATGEHVVLLAGRLLVTVDSAVLSGRGGMPPAGTPGAVEVVDLTARSGIQADAAVVSHSGGTEVVLEIDGLTDARPHQVVLRVDGTDVPAGSFLGTDVTITCRMNAAIPRADVDAL